ncbi:hypothetical protein DB345_21010 [Spartobacteria bacterium LR76]|nr:hypothetical protein DB345_21010 [Spartobacteria bacterium LR76]
MKKSFAAFSLVEVTLALGIVSVSLLSLIGLLPAGLGALRESMDQTVHAQILQRIAAGVSTSEFASLTGQTLTFDQEGQLLAGASDASARYTAKVQESTPSLPGLSADADIAQMQDHLKRIRIGITRSNVPNAQVVWYAIQVAAR